MGTGQKSHQIFYLTLQSTIPEHLHQELSSSAASALHPPCAVAGWQTSAASCGKLVSYNKGCGVAVWTVSGSHKGAHQQKLSSLYQGDPVREVLTQIWRMNSQSFPSRRNSFSPRLNSQLAC